MFDHPIAHTARAAIGSESNDQHDQTTAIALFSGYYPPHCGGIELVCADLVDGLCRLGKKLNWIALDGGTFEVHANCAVTPASGSDVIYRRSGIPFPILRLTALRLIWAAVRKAGVIVIADANFLISIAAFISAKAQRKPVLLIQHVGAPSTVSLVASTVMKIAEMLAVRPMLRSADQVVFVSAVVAKHFSNLRTQNPPQIIGHGVDTDVFSPAISKQDKSARKEEFGLRPEHPVACFVGRCTVSKGVEVFVRMAKLRPDWQFVVAGAGPVDPASDDLPNLKALGQLDRATLAKLYRASDVLVLPSRSESFSLVVREALAAEVKVLCGDQILETDADVGKYVSALPVCLNAPQKTAELFSAALDESAAMSTPDGRAYVQAQCSWPRIFRRYAALIDGLGRGPLDASLALRA